ncbi:MAG: ammonium transporter [Clostridiales bacterium]
MINSGDIAFLIICTLIVILMTPGVAILYGGLVDKKHTNTMIMQNFIAITIITLVWAICGFTIAYGNNIAGGFIGGFDYLFLQGVSAEPHAILAPTVPFTLFFVLQAAFAIITPALICGALVGRARLLPYVIFIALWSLLIYSPVVHWVWGGGFLSQWGYIDFAGGVPVHMIAGFSALAAVIALGNRKIPKDGPSNMMHLAISMGILCAGWFAFNTCSALAANATAAVAATNTLLAAAAGSFMWLILGYIKNKKADLLDIFFGILAGLVVSSPISGFVSPWVAMISGFIAGLFCYYAVQFRTYKNWDDTLDVWAIHGCGGLLGVLIVGLCANPAIAPTAGLLYGNSQQLLIQASGILIGGLYSFILTFVLIKVINKVCPFNFKKDHPEFETTKQDISL